MKETNEKLNTTENSQLTDVSLCKGFALCMHVPFDIVNITLKGNKANKTYLVQNTGSYSKSMHWPLTSCFIVKWIHFIAQTSFYDVFGCALCQAVSRSLTECECLQMFFSRFPSVYVTPQICKVSMYYV